MGRAQREALTAQVFGEMTAKAHKTTQSDRLESFSSWRFSRRNQFGLGRSGEWFGRNSN